MVTDVIRLIRRLPVECANILFIMSTCCVWFVHSIIKVHGFSTASGFALVRVLTAPVETSRKRENCLDSSWREERKRLRGGVNNDREGTVVVNVCTCMLEGVEASWEKFHIFLYTIGKMKIKPFIWSCTVVSSCWCLTLNRLNFSAYLLLEELQQTEWVQKGVAKQAPDSVPNCKVTQHDWIKTFHFAI